MLDFVRKKYEGNAEDEFKDSEDWNLLVFDITLWIFRKSLESEIQRFPFIPAEGSTTIWGEWFWRVVSALGGEFNDVTPSLVYRCLKNCPHEDVAMIVFDTIDMDDIKGYFEGEQE